MNLKCVLLCERRQFKEATLDDSNYMAFWKRQTMEIVKRINVCQSKEIPHFGYSLHFPND